MTFVLGLAFLGRLRLAQAKGLSGAGLRLGFETVRIARPLARDDGDDLWLATAKGLGGMGVRLGFDTV